MPDQSRSCQDQKLPTRRASTTRSTRAAIRARWLAACLLGVAGSSFAATVTNFDEAIMRGLPAGLRGDMPDSAAKNAETMRAGGIMHVETRMPVKVVYFGKDKATLYRGKVDGYPAIFTRYADRLDIFVNAAPHADAYNMTYTTGRTAPEKRVLTRAAINGRATDVVLPPDQKTRLPAMPGPSAATTGNRDSREILFSIFIHDDAKGVAINDHLSWWIALMEGMLPAGQTMTVDLKRDLPGITDFSYAGDNPGAKLSQCAIQVRTQFPREPFDYENKFLLFTKNLLNASMGGIAHQGGDYGIASSGSHQFLAHEMGHMLSATHENAEIRYNGWWCETIMVPAALDLRSNCYDYSDANRKRIQNYLKCSASQSCGVDVFSAS